MNIEVRKINLINWISSLQDESVLDEMEKIQRSKNDWWDKTSEKDKKAIHEGLNQLNKGDFLTRDQVRSKLKEKFKL